MAKFGRPNVLIFHVDEQPWNTLTCYGNRHARTVSIDRLSTQGCRLTQCFSQSFDPLDSCLSLLCGQYPSRIAACPKPPPTLGRILKSYGYLSSAFGALQIRSGASDAASFIGFDQAELTRGFGEDDAYKAFLKVRAPESLALISQAISSGKHKLVPEEHSCNAFTAGRALDAMHQHARVGQPFLCMLGLRAFETPLIAPLRFYSAHDPGALPASSSAIKADQPKAREHNYYACVSEIDALVGSVLQELERLQLAHNTIVVYTASRGRYAGGMLSGEKPFADSMVHVPLVVRGPADLVHSDLVSGAMVELIDLAPTLLELMGIQAPPQMQGQSFRGLLAGETNQHRTSAVAELPGGRLLRSSNFSYMVRADGSEAMYDLAKPETQNTDVGNDLRYRGVICEHRRQLLARLVEASDGGCPSLCGC